MKNPIEVHLLVAKRIFRYLKDIIDFGTLYKNGGNSSLIGFSDNDYARDLDDRRSAFGSMFIFNFGVVTWSSTKQKVVTLSTIEVEFDIATSSSCQAIWLQRLIEVLHD